MSIAIPRRHVEQYLVERRAEGNHYVKSTNVESDTGMDRETAGRVLSQLEDEGQLEAWSKNRGRDTYHIPERFEVDHE